MRPLEGCGKVEASVTSYHGGMHLHVLVITDAMGSRAELVSIQTGLLYSEPLGWKRFQYFLLSEITKIDHAMEI